MYRPVRMFSFASFLFMFANPVVAQESAARLHTHIRSANSRLCAVIALGVKVSPTLRTIVERIESSDVITYIDMRLLTTPGVAAQSQFVNAAGGRRYVRVLIDSRFNGTVRSACSATSCSTWRKSPASHRSSTISWWRRSTAAPDSEVRLVAPTVSRAPRPSRPDAA